MFCSPLCRPAPLALALSLAFASATLYAQGPAAGLPSAPVPFNMAAKPLSQALSEWALLTRMQLIVPPALVAGKTAPAVSGNLRPQQALNQLLAGSGLSARIDGSAVIIQDAAAPASGAGATLGEVTVTAQADLPSDLPPPYAGGQVARGSRMGLLGNKDVMDTPFNITSYTAELMENQQALTVADVLANDPSVRTVSYGLTNASGAGDLFLIRGFSTQNSVLFDGVGGVAPSRTIPVETAERIEVLKGPSALLNGMAPGVGGSIGGAINMVPKRADDAPLTRFTTSYASKGNLGGHLDAGRRFGEDHQWGVRFNGAYRNGDTATEGQSVELSTATVALDYRGRGVRASVDAGHQTMNNEAPQGAGGFGIDDTIAIPKPPNASKRLAQDWEYSKTKSDYLLAKAEVDLNPNWTLYGAAGGSNNHFQYLSTDIYVTDTQGNAQATAYYWPDWNNYRTAQAGLRGAFNTGSVKHQVNVNATYLKKDHGYTVDYYGFSSFNTNIYNPPLVARPSTAGFASNPANTDTLELPSLALSDTISFWEDRLAITLGARYQRVKYITYDTSTGVGNTTYDENAVTPVLAAVFKPMANMSVYGNYIEGLTQGDTAPMGTTNAQQVFPPIKTKQYEVGVKYDFGSFTSTVSAFQIEKPSGLTVSNGDGTFTYQVGAEQRNRGLELNVFGEPTRGTRLLGGVTYTAAKLTHTSSGSFDGNTAPNVARWQLNLGGEVDLAAVPGLTLTTRMISTSAQYLD
jgi:iron complex outermembrane receptor protein